MTCTSDLEGTHIALNISLVSFLLYLPFFSKIDSDLFTFILMKHELVNLLIILDTFINCDVRPCIVLLTDHNFQVS